jgi:hypothetical protein
MGPQLRTEGSAKIDIALESIRALDAMGVLVFLRFSRRRHLTSQPGLWMVVVCFGLLDFGSVVDITDNFESLNGRRFLRNVAVARAEDHTAGTQDLRIPRPVLCFRHTRRIGR